MTAVPVMDSELLPGDGYLRVVRPFRTVEDIHVQAAVFAYLIRQARLHGFPRNITERLAAVVASLRGLSIADPSTPEVHVAVAGALALSRAPIDELEKLWSKTESPDHAYWERDRLVFTVGARVRGERLERAWRSLAGEEGSVG